MVSYGSDWDNISEPDPWFALEGMVTRQYPGKPEFGQPGKFADFIVINQNLLEIPPQKIHEIKVLRTVLNGHTVYEAKVK